jgi:hypothetical protein
MQAAPQKVAIRMVITTWLNQWPVMVLPRLLMFGLIEDTIRTSLKLCMPCKNTGQAQQPKDSQGIYKE